MDWVYKEQSDSDLKRTDDHYAKQVGWIRLFCLNPYTPCEAVEDLGNIFHWVERIGSLTLTPWGSVLRPPGVGMRGKGSDWDTCLLALWSIIHVSVVWRTIRPPGRGASLVRRASYFSIPWPTPASQMWLTICLNDATCVEVSDAPLLDFDVPWLSTWRTPNRAKNYR